MATISILSPNYSPVVHNRRLLSAKVLLPECFTAIDTWMNGCKNVSLNCQVLHHKQIPKVHKQIRKVTEIPEASSILDADVSTPRNPEVMNKTDQEADSMIKYIRTMLSTMEDGRISVSPYDTAWIALIKDVEGRDIPQFPSSLEWIAQHQLPDGSWGDVYYFCPYDRIINTLACVVALRSWNVYVDKAEKGISYIKENIHKLEEAKAEHMPGGFELIIPALLQRARKLGIDDMPYDAPVVKQLHDAKNRKLKRIPMELLHEVPTTLLYSLEGLENLEWEKLLKLQSPDGSFLTSPSSTAFAFMETKDENCFKFINNIVEEFNGGAPHTYPVDLFARLWAVDRLQRLGISHFFESEIKDCLSYFSRYWTDNGVFSGRGSILGDIDDTSMGFRLLRLHGYDVDPNVLRNFKQDDKFSCFSGQMIESPSPIYNLYRASQVRFPGETILEEANNFAYNFLRESLARNEFLDKWVISKHLYDEISIGLEMPWYVSLPRVEARYYLQHYGGADDVWIGKNLYRMEEISNDTYLELARLDFNRCQEQHQFEWTYMQEWYESSNVQEFGISKKDLLVAYFLAAATIFEHERTKERILWAKSQILSRMITSFFINETTSLEHKTALLTEFRDNTNLPHKTYYRLVDILLATLHQLQEGFDERISHQLKNTWGVWMMKLHQDEAYWSEDAELLVTTLNICAGHTVNKEEDILSHHEYNTLSKLTNKICGQLSQIQNIKVMEMHDGKGTTKCNIKEIEQDMQTLVKLVIKESVGIDKNIKQTFLSVARTFYYSSYNDAEIIDVHIFKVLFEPVV